MRRGFSFIELLVVVSIVAVLTVVAYPAYEHYVIKTRRSDAHVALLDLATKMDRYYTENHSYLDATLSNVGADATSQNHYYELVISETTPVEYKIQATPVGAQTKDILCGALTYDHLGVKGISGNGLIKDCW